MTAIVYRIDGNDFIVDTGGAWDDFAAANGGLGTVAGRPLWSFVAGDDVRAIWSLLLRRARTKGEPVTFLYRCDAPGIARVLQMELRAHGDESVTFTSTQVRTMPARTFAGRSEEDSMVTVCGWCSRVRVGDEWRPAERAAELLGLVEDEQPRLSHGVCATCARELRSGFRP